MTERWGEGAKRGGRPHGRGDATPVPLASSPVISASPIRRPFWGSQRSGAQEGAASLRAGGEAGPLPVEGRAGGFGTCARWMGTGAWLGCPRTPGVWRSLPFP